MQSKQPRRPGELVFNAAIAVVCLYLLWSAYTISGFEAFSAPGAMPMAFTGIMSVTALLVLWESWRKSGASGEKLERDILPANVVGTIVLIIAYAVILKPLGFLPTSFLFLFAAIWMLSRRNPLWCAGMALLSVALIYLVFRMIFSVLMPEGIVPEREIIAFIRTLFVGGK
ncbi:MAG: tripartite tricarboxylate transporter TctB family protein [Paracoccaceae bacterium]|nr:tripartite tricarboxylate transporter TctB family protein [Paracoccaceae bacterium]